MKHFKDILTGRLKGLKYENVYVNDIRVNDCVQDLDGHWVTVGKGDIKRGFCGMTFEGYPYEIRGIKIKRALFPRWFQGEIIGWVSQL